MKKLFLFVLFILFVFLSLSIGGSKINLFEILKNLDDSNSYILFQLRIPRTLTCLLVGASLGTAGALLQTVLQNPLAEPYTLGLSGAASLGAVLVLILNMQPFWLYSPLAAFALCMASTVLILKLSKRATLQHQKSIVLSGVMISLFFGSLVILLLTLLKPLQLQTALFWMTGQVGTERDQWWPMLLALYVIVFFWLLTKLQDLDRILLGSEISKTLGTDFQKLLKHVIIAVALLTSTSVTVAGLIGFVGLLAPHFCFYLFKTHRHKLFLPMSAFLGSQFLLAADVLGRAISSDIEVAAGGLIALIGAPILILLIYKRDGHVEA